MPEEPARHQLLGVPHERCARGHKSLFLSARTPVFSSQHSRFQNRIPEDRAEGTWIRGCGSFPLEATGPGWSRGGTQPGRRAVSLGPSLRPAPSFTPLFRLPALLFMMLSAVFCFVERWAPLHRAAGQALLPAGTTIQAKGLPPPRSANITFGIKNVYYSVKLVTLRLRLHVRLEPSSGKAALGDVGCQVFCSSFPAFVINTLDAEGPSCVFPTRTPPLQECTGGPCPSSGQKSHRPVLWSQCLAQKGQLTQGTGKNHACHAI